MAAPLLVFDLDGTLVDSAPDLLATLDAILPRHGFQPLLDRSLRDGIGHGARHLIEYALHRQRRSADEARLAQMHRDFLDHYEANICVESRLYPGAIALLDRFGAAGWSFAVCTNKVEFLSRHVLAALGVETRFAVIGGGDTFSSRKPHPAHLLQTIASAPGTADNAVMIGDSRTDLDTARSAGVPFIGVSFGYTPVPMAELEPDLLINGFDELGHDDAARLLVRARAPVESVSLHAAIP